MTEQSYTKRAARVLELAGLAAGGEMRTTEHLLLGLIGEGGGVAAQTLFLVGATADRVGAAAAAVRSGALETTAGRFDSAGLASIGIDVERVAASVDGLLDRDAVGRGPSVSAAVSGTFGHTLVAARGQRARLRHRCVGTEHLLLALLAQPGSVAVAALGHLGLDSSELADLTERQLRRHVEAASTAG